MKTLSRRNIAIQIILILWFMIAMYFQNNIGLADNGDFTRSITWISSGPIGIEPNWPAAGTEEWVKRFYNYWLPFWKLEGNAERPTTSAFLLWLPGALLNYIIYSKTILYTPILALVPKLILFGVLLVVFRWIERNARDATVLLLSMGIPLVLIFTNTEYIAYFNSFYLEPASFIFLFLLLVSILLLKYRSSSAYLLGSLACILLLATAKPANLYWPFLAVPFVLYAWSVTGKMKVRTLIVASLVLIPLLTFVARAVTAAGSNQANPYNSLFSGVLKFSDDPSARLRDLGIDNATQCLGTTAFTAVGNTCLTEYQSQISYRNTLHVIYKEPLLFFRMAGFVFDNMQDLSVDYLGKYAFDDPRSKTSPRVIISGERQRFWSPTAESSFFNLWAKLKFQFFPIGYALPVALLCFSLWFIRKLKDDGIQQDLALIGLLCTFACIADMVIVVLGDGTVELVRHLFLSNLLFDIAALAFMNSLLLAWMNNGLPAFMAHIPSPTGRKSHTS